MCSPSNKVGTAVVVSVSKHQGCDASSIAEQGNVSDAVSQVVKLLVSYPIVDRTVESVCQFVRWHSAKTDSLYSVVGVSLTF